jgi:hypothetical protein
MALGGRAGLAGVSTPDHPDEREAHRIATDLVGPGPPGIAGTAAPGVAMPSDGAAPSPGGGTGLLPGQRTYFEGRFGVDLGQVRVHTDHAADAAARAVDAVAFTRGDDIGFRRAAYAPDSPAGRYLLAHELAHVVQARSRGGGPSVFRVPAAPTPVARRDRDHLLGNAGLGIVAMTLSDFADYTKRQSDWFAHPTLAVADRTFLWDMLLLTNKPYIRTGIGDLRLSDIRGVAVADWPALDAFARGTYSGEHTVRIFPPFPALADRIGLGATLLALEAIILPAQAELTVSQSQLQALRADPTLLPLLADYWSKFEPFLEHLIDPSAGGAGPEFALVLAFLNAIKGAGGLAPLMPLRGTSPADRWVRNLHRFPLTMLNQLVTNLGEKSGIRRLVLVLHSGHDPSGSFQFPASNPLADLVANTGRIALPVVGVVAGPDNLVLMVEGARSLADLTARIPTITTTYGQIVGGVRRISQVMIAGHGSPTSVSLAGYSPPAVAGGTVNYTQEFVKTGDPAGQALLDALMKHLDPATARVLYVGCLVGARRVPAGTPAAAIPGAVAASQSLAAWTETRAIAAGIPIVAGTTVQGGRASVGASAITSLKDFSGNLAPTYPFDPAAFGSAAGYVPVGVEPEGVLRAAVEVAATSGSIVAETMLRTRLAMPARPADWYDIVTRMMIGIVLPAVAGTGVDVVRLNEAANVAEVPFLVRWPEPKWSNAARFVTRLNPLPFAADVYTGLAGTGEYTTPTDAPTRRLRVVVDQGRFRLTGSAATLITGLAAAALRADLLSPHLDVTATVLGGHEAALLPIGPPPTLEHARLALAWYMRNNTTAHVKAFLSAQVTVPVGLPPAFSPLLVGEIGAAHLDAAEMLTDLGFPSTASAAPVGLAPSAPLANVQVPGSPANTVFVTPGVRRTTVKATKLNVRATPNGATLGALKAGDPVVVAGTVGSWSAIDWSGRLGFVWTAYLNP